MSESISAGLPDRFWAKVNKAGPVPPHRPDLGPCWAWTAAVSDKGYGQWRAGSAKTDGSRRMASTHKAAYRALVGEVPAGLELDHLCRNRACCNPAHLEPVTHVVNMRRGSAGQNLRDAAAAVTHCPSGHEYTAANTRRKQRGIYVSRHCIECARAYDRRRSSRKRVAA